MHMYTYAMPLHAFVFPVLIVMIYMHVLYVCKYVYIHVIYMK